MPPQKVYWFDDGQLAHVYAVKARDPKTFKRVYVNDPETKIPVQLSGFSLQILGFIPGDIHLLGVEGVPIEESLFLLGTDVNSAIYGRA